MASVIVVTVPTENTRMIYRSPEVLMNVLIQCTGMMPKSNFTIELTEASGGGELRIWDTASACTGDPGSRAITIDSNSVVKWCEELRRLRVAAISGGPIALDAMAYEVTITDGSCKASYAWSADPPSGWRRLHSIVENIVSCATTGNR
jgi:hypothetical protein